MTLIAGIILPNGILMMSDTRTLENKIFVHNEDTRKITFVTPTTLLGSSGSETVYHTAQVLRHTLYGKQRLTKDNIRTITQDLYQRVNLYHLVERDIPEPLGHILLGEFNPTKNEYTLYSNSGEGQELFSKYTEYKQLKDVVLVGSSHAIRETTKQQIQNFLDSIPLDQEGAPRKIAELCHNIFKQQAAIHHGINRKLYCIHLTTRNGLPIADAFLRDEFGKVYSIDPNEDSRDIHYEN
ncbi:hypothetical protein U2I54_16125 [Bacillus pseudomycoides]|uniref:Uncharacterized protein n=1 Tax=Bacillus bingmayongensis TaxID=1150157 RepID=A0ABU5JYR9_9BACI|nr:hypothetical protein [Bacillus pseudomycoides]